MDYKIDTIFAREVSLKYHFFERKGKSSFEADFPFIYTIIR